MTISHYTTSRAPICTGFATGAAGPATLHERTRVGSRCSFLASRRGIDWRTVTLTQLTTYKRWLELNLGAQVLALSGQESLARIDDLERGNQLLIDENTRMTNERDELATVVDQLRDELQSSRTAHARLMRQAAGECTNTIHLASKKMAVARRRLQSGTYVAYVGRRRQGHHHHRCCSGAVETDGGPCATAES